MWEGRLNRARVQELFMLSAVRASECIREFREKHPNWIEWDSKTRSYYSTPAVYQAGLSRKRDTSTSLSEYLTLIGISHIETEANQNRVIWSAFPDLSVPTPGIFSVLYNGIRLHRTVEITYRSMTEPKPHKRLISPHSLVRAGRRWHVRAFCSLHKEFRDYALGRIANAKVQPTQSERLEKDDVAWLTKVRVRIVAHPDLTTDQEEVIRFEYFNNTSARIETCRGALVGYFIHDLRAATDIKRQRPPDYQLAVANVDEVKKWLFPE